MMMMRAILCIGNRLGDVLKIFVGAFVVLTRAKVDDFEFIICSLVLFQHDILRLQVSMDDIVLMAIVDGRQNMLHYLCSILLWQPSLLQNLVKQLASRADFCNDEEALLILKVLIDLDNIWMIEILENIDFVIKRLLFMLAHALFANHLHCSLVSCLDVDDSAHFTKCSLTQGLAHSVVVDDFALSSASEVDLTCGIGTHDFQSERSFI
jgi:hypothetical protein